MTREKKKAMIQAVSGVISAFVIAVLTFTYAYGKQAEKVESIEKMLERRFDRIDESLLRYNQELDAHTHDNEAHTY